MNIKYISIICTIGLLSAFGLFSCNLFPAPEGGHDHDHGMMAGDDDHADKEIFLTKEQMQTMGVKFGDFSSIKINDYISATGTLGLPPNAYTSLSAKANGFIVGSNKYVEGSYVKKGIIMAYLENPEFIKYQQDYLEVKAELNFLKLELERQQNLVDASAGVLKNLQKLESEIEIKTAKKKGLAKHLSYLGINVAQLSPDNIVDQIAIIAPMAGYITSIKMHNGMYTKPEMELMEIVSENHLHLELDVFEKDISKVEEGQKISYLVPALGGAIYEGEVHVIGKEFNTENKTVRIHGHLDQERPKFIKDLFVEAKIWLTDQVVQALPEKAVIKDGTNSYIYVADYKMEASRIEFYKILVIPGLTEDGFTTITMLNEIPEGMRMVTEGAFYVYAQSKAGTVEHSH